jgi:hypothetical protein
MQHRKRIARGFPHCRRQSARGSERSMLANGAARSKPITVAADAPTTPPDSLLKLGHSVRRWGRRRPPDPSRRSAARATFPHRRPNDSPRRLWPEPALPNAARRNL